MRRRPERLLCPEAAAKAGAEPYVTEAQHALAVENWPLAWSAARRLHRKFPDWELDDIRSICSLALFHAARKWEPGRGAFSTYHFWWCRSGLQHAMVKDGLVRKDRKRQGPRKSIYSEEILAVTADRDADIPEMVDHHARSQAMREAIGLLPERYAFVIEEVVLKERPLRDVGSEMGLSYERVRQLKNLGIEILRRRLEATWATAS